MICDGCGTDFSDDVELFPKFVITKDERMARKLAEKQGDGKEEMLCITCWLQALQLCEKDALGMLLLGMLRKQRALETELLRQQNSGSPFGGITIEKLRKKNTWAPNATPIWKHDPTIYTAPSPQQPFDTTQVWCNSQSWMQAAMADINRGQSSQEDV